MFGSLVFESHCHCSDQFRQKSKYKATVNYILYVTTGFRRFSLHTILSVTMQKIESCLEDIATWMSLNKHKLNSEKTELLGIGSQNLSASQFPSFTAINGSVIQPSQFVGNIGVIFDNKLNMERQVAAICKSAFFQIRNISRIRKFLSVSCTKALVHAFVTCRLDNCNSLLYGLPKYLVHRLQSPQNCVVRLILCGRKFDRITPLLKELHWLPVEQMIIFEILQLTFKALNNLCPSYISDLLETYKPARTLRSSGEAISGSTL